MNTYGIRKSTAMDYYHIYQEVQAAKQAARLNVKTELTVHEREKHAMNVEERKSTMVASNIGSLLDIKA